MGAESSKSTGGDLKKEINPKKTDSQIKTSSDELRNIYYEKQEIKAAETTKKEFHSNPKKVASVDTWLAKSSDLRPLHRNERPINYDQVGTSISTKSGLEDLDAPSHKELQLYEEKKYKIINDIQKKISILSKKYLSDMEKLDKKLYNNPNERLATLTQRYRTYRSDAKQILSNNTIEMRKLAKSVGLTHKQVERYTSDTENQGIHQLLGEPRYDKSGRLLPE